MENKPTQDQILMAELFVRANGTIAGCLSRLYPGERIQLAGEIAKLINALEPRR
jgi:hypothetical protein